MFYFSDVLALPIFKQEESSLPPDNENEILPFQYVLCAATSPAVKLHDERSHLLVPLEAVGLRYVTYMPVWPVS